MREDERLVTTTWAPKAASADLWRSSRVTAVRKGARALDCPREMRREVEIPSRFRHWASGDQFGKLVPNSKGSRSRTTLLSQERRMQGCPGAVPPGPYKARHRCRRRETP